MLVTDNPRPAFRLLAQARRVLAEDGASAALWVIVTVPPSFGFWLVAGDLAGVPRTQARTLIAASLLAIGVATLIQVLAGYRLAVFEGPASTYLAAVAVLHASAGGSHPRAITGGLLAAALLVFTLGAVGANRVIKRLFTPVVVNAFLLIVVITVTPDTVDRLLGRSHAHPLGVTGAWVSAALVIAIASLGQRVRVLRAYSLVGALIAGSLVYFAIDGDPAGVIGTHWTTPSPLPWGAPELTFAIAVPFLVSGLLASFNTIASVNVLANGIEQPAQPDQERRGIAAHGLAQGLTACFGNVTGHVPRLDSVGVVRLLDNSRPRALALAALGIIGLAFLSPLVDVIALIPVPVSAALLAFVLALLVIQGLRQIATLDRRSRWLVLVPAVVPALVWLPVGKSLSETVQLVANPLLIGVALGVVLDRLVNRPARASMVQRSS